ncbi:caldesmon [Vespula squamosa]|uniref:Caldesmon n=1 Tax=Vespula squamosa TaxID=30214 RepID=A0ABD2AUC0_VESSQ
MELNKSSSNDDNNKDLSSSEDSSAKRIKLEKEIENLKHTVKELQQKLKIAKLNNMKKSLNLNNAASTSNQVVSMNVDYELYKYGGLYCVHIFKNEYTIGLNSSWKQQKQNLFAIQLLKEGKKIMIGKWVMPMSVDMKQLLSEIPLNTTNDVIPFLQNCKYHCNCYMFRLQQYQELKSSVDNLNNCNVQPNVAYTLFIIELLNVYDKINESYANITIYLRYDSIHVRPTEIKLEITGSIKYDEQTEKLLRKSIKGFYYDNLQTAFDNILKDDNVQFTWTRVKKEDTILEINESSSSEDDLLSLYSSENEISRKRQKQSESQIKNKQKNKENNINNTLDQQDTNIKLQRQSSKKEIHTKASTSKPIKTAYSDRLSKVQTKTIKRRSRYTSSLNTFDIKLRPRRSTSKMVQNNTKIKPLSIRLQKIKNNHTSTPIRSDRQNLILFKRLPKLDISDIIDKEDTE